MRRDTLSEIDGLYVGDLDDGEMEAFNEACERGEASRSYEGAGGFMGLAKVRVHRPATREAGDPS